jgi:hypothetical protein
MAVKIKNSNKNKNQQTKLGLGKIVFQVIVFFYISYLKYNSEIDD